MIIKGIGGKLLRFFQGRIRARSSQIPGTTIPDFCLSLFPPDPPGTVDLPLVILFSGDGGWANLTSTVAEHLQQKGFPVLGIDSMQYFWNSKEPEVAAQELEHTILRFQREWKTRDLILVGYSMGADVLPVITKNLTEELRSRVKKLFLLSPSQHVELKFRFIGWLGYQSPHDRGIAILPDVESLAREFPIVAIAGEKERDSLTYLIPESITKKLIFPGGHHYKGDYTSLAKAIVTEIGF